MLEVWRIGPCISAVVGTLPELVGALWLCSLSVISSVCMLPLWISLLIHFAFSFPMLPSKFFD